MKISEKFSEKEKKITLFKRSNTGKSESEVRGSLQIALDI